MATHLGTVPLELGFDAPDAVREALAAMGRTEDVRLAPNRRRLAFACYARKQIAVADVEISVSASGPKVAVTSLELFSSSGLDEPHGVDFVDDDTLIVGDRSGAIVILRLPQDGGPADGGVARLLESPGSVAVRSLGSGRHEVLVCSNFGNTVSRHELDADGVLGAGHVLVRAWLDLPDGVTTSRDGRWLAVSNHNSHCVFVYDTSTVDADADPVCILRGVHYPHGIRFGPDDRYLVVADAGAPHVHVFVPSDDGWQGVAYPTATIRVMDDETFARGRHNPTEGGPKGVDVDPATGVLLVTSECRPLALFDVGTALEEAGAGFAEDARLRYELHVLAERRREREGLEASAAKANATLEEVMQTKAWRMTLPLRRAYTAARHLKPRRRPDA